MTILFESELGVTFAISKNVTHKGRWNDELLWAEIEQKNDKLHYLRWEDDYMNKIPFSNEESARDVIQRDHLLHKPHINGATFDIKEE